MAPAATLGARAERTRSSILQAAEAVFAERGFAAARLEDVAERVGIRRASIVYYFKDKQELYETVLDGVFADLLARIDEVFGAPEPLTDRIEAGVSAWVDFVGSRPTFARLVLREVANAVPGQQPALFRQTQPFFEVIQRQVFERARREGTQLAPIDPAHTASAIAGATLFFVAVLPVLVPELGFDPLSKDQLERHRTQVLHITRRLLGTS